MLLYRVLRLFKKKIFYKDVKYFDEIDVIGNFDDKVIVVCIINSLLMVLVCFWFEWYLVVLINVVFVVYNIVFLIEWVFL